MRKVQLLLIFFSFISTSLIAQQSNTNSQFSLFINGKEYAIEEGKELKLNETLTNPVFKIVSELNHTFDNGTISFKYPKSFAKEEEGGIGYKSWTLDGNDFNIMLFNFDGKIETEAFTDIIIKKFGKKNCSQSQIQKTIGNKQMDGVRLKISIAKIIIHQDFFKLPIEGKISSFLVFQSTESDNGGLSEEELSTMKLFNETVKY